MFKALFIIGTAIASSLAMALSFDADVPVTIKIQMEADLAFIGGIQGSGQTALHKEVFGDVSGITYKKFFESHIQTVGISYCRNGLPVACVFPTINENKLFLTQNFVKLSIPQTARLMVIYHESRHAEKENKLLAKDIGFSPNWPHANCPIPFLDNQGRDKTIMKSGEKLEGLPACDTSAYGSYGSSTILFKNLSKFCRNCSDKIKMDADLFASDQLSRISDAGSLKSMLVDFNEARLEGYAE